MNDNRTALTAETTSAPTGEGATPPAGTCTIATRPAWCVAPHDGEDTSEYAHYSDGTLLTFPGRFPGRLDVCLNQYDDEAPVVVLYFVDYSPDGEAPKLDYERVLSQAFASQLARSLDRLVALAQTPTAGPGHARWCVDHDDARGDELGGICRAADMPAPAEAPGDQGAAVRLSHDPEDGTLITLACKTEDLTEAEAEHLYRALGAQLAVARGTAAA